jgi:hypothetical protein
VQPFPAELAGVIGVGERGEHQVAVLEPGDVPADVLDDAQELVPHRPALLIAWHRVIRV